MLSLIWAKITISFVMGQILRIVNYLFPDAERLTFQDLSLSTGQREVLCVLKKKRGPQTAGRVIEQNKLHVLGDALGSQRDISADGDGELDAVLLAENVQPVQEVLGLHVHIALDDLGQAVDEDVGGIEVSGVQTADKALEHIVVGDVVSVRLHQTNLGIDVVGQLAAALNANDVAVLSVDGGIDEVDHLLGLTGALDTHDDSNHNI